MMKKIYLILVFLMNSMLLVAATYYLHPTDGHLDNDGSQNAPWSSLEDVINAGYIVSNAYSPLPYDPSTSSLVPKNSSGYVQANDTLLLMDGLHGTVFLESYVNSAPITIMGMPEHTPHIHNVYLRTCRHWRFVNLSISNEPFGAYTTGDLFYVESHNWQGPSAHITIDQCTIRSANTPWTEADEWNNKMSNGIIINADSIIVRNCLIENTNFALQAHGNYIEATNNQINNFAGDGMRAIGSHINFSYNLIKNCYKVNDNHDDGIQSWAQINGVIADDNKIIGNIIINTDDPNRALNGPLQGIGCFDGFYNRWQVINNLVIVDHWHGITLLGANDCKIINNTVLDMTPAVAPGPAWIMIDDHKDGTPSAGCIIANNVANDLRIDGQNINNIILTTDQEYSANFVDYSHFDFHLTPSSQLIDNADASYAPALDIDQLPRPRGAAPDIGAYEFQGVSTVATRKNVNIVVYPNPSSDAIYIYGDREIGKISLHDISGKIIYPISTLLHDQVRQIDLSNVMSGNYILTIFDKADDLLSINKIIIKQ